MPDISTEVAIATTTLGTASATITFSSIPATYTDLRLVLTGWPDVTTTIGVQFNSDTGSNYSRTRLYGDGTSAGSDRNTSQVYLGSGSLFSTTAPGLLTIDIFSYAGSTNKTALCTASSDQNGSGQVQRNVGLWRSTAAITSIYLYCVGGVDFQSGTTATLYGIL
jgi:hypothetical protein